VACQQDSTITEDTQTEDLDGQCQGRPEREKHQHDQDWQSDQKQRGLEKP